MPPYPMIEDLLRLSQAFPKAPPEPPPAPEDSPPLRLYTNDTDTFWAVDEEDLARHAAEYDYEPEDMQDFWEHGGDPICVRFENAEDLATFLQNEWPAGASATIKGFTPGNGYYSWGLEATVDAWRAIAKPGHWTSTEI